MRKLSTAETLAAQIQDGATIAISGNGGGMVEADHILAAIEARFLQTGHPRDLTLIPRWVLAIAIAKALTVLLTPKCSNALLPDILPGRPRCRNW